MQHCHVNNMLSKRSRIISGICIIILLVGLVAHRNSEILVIRAQTTIHTAKNVSFIYILLDL